MALLIGSGTIVGRDEKDAAAKLNQDGFSKLRLEHIRGVEALWKHFTAGIK